MFKKLFISTSLLSLFVGADTAFAQEVAPEEAIEKSAEESNEDTSEKDKQADNLLHVYQDPILQMPKDFPKKFTYDDGVDIAYPEDGVKGLYLSSYAAAGDKMAHLTDLVNSTDLNSMVIDVKEDNGNITVDFGSDNKMINNATTPILDPKKLMDHLEENDIYPIARIVVFKDTMLAEEYPELSFENEDGTIWANRRNEKFVNPFCEEVWKYNVEIAKEAAKLGFKDIQFDYVRFPEGFETRDEQLAYTQGKYANSDQDNVQKRVQAVTDFVDYAQSELAPYGVDVSVDIFGYTAMVREAPGIGQNFSKIAKEVDVISSMIYPSHWGPGNLGVSKPDLEPYEVVNNYIEMEADIFKSLGEDTPTTRPWLQDFTASYLGAGNYINYGDEELSAQIKALEDHGIEEYLIWNAASVYSEGATFNY